MSESNATIRRRLPIGFTVSSRVGAEGLILFSLVYHHLFLSTNTPVRAPKDAIAWWRQPPLVRLPLGHGTLSHLSLLLPLSLSLNA
ncbi:unnamed protein product [Lactuca virosa]|uniref:Uncharacterized protein n=1 Tax=Lactuca virosa TaxID=75947 RepID=A0AAU9P0A7_9ASTR|nr:unnamed protein product [Lactuca virosa]